MKLNRMSIFETVKVPFVPRSRFDLSHEVKASLDMGFGVPILRQEVLPGDKFEFSTESFLRLAPMLAPTMHNVDVKTRFFFVPNRILMDQQDWEYFIMGDADAGIEWPWIGITEGTAPLESLGDYLGYPQVTGSKVIKASVLPLAAYCKVWDDYYRSEAIQAEKFEKVIPGENNQRSGYYADLAAGKPFKVGWERDYFTSALPTPQKGDPVLIPLTSSDPQVYLQDYDVTGNYQKFKVLDGGNNWVNSGSDSTISQSGAGNGNISATGGDFGVIDPNGTLAVDANSAAATIDTLRTAFKLQQYFETLFRAGSRYFEWVRSIFATTPSDARLQRSEYIGTQHGRMVISEVLSTANTEVSTDVTPVGQMAGHGISVSGGKRMYYSAEEHGWIIGILQVTPQTAYQQGIDRCLTRENYLDYAIPMFANIGEQPVYRKELFADTLNGDDVFGYQPRYAEYRFNNSRVLGQFKDTLLFWHMGRVFDSDPILNPAFIECNPTKRIFAVEDGSHIYAQIILNIYVDRNLPRFGVPSLM